MATWQITGRLYSDANPQNQRRYTGRKVNFTVDAEDKEEAKFLFSHGVTLGPLAEQSEHYSADLDFRTVKLTEAHDDQA